MVKTRRWRLGRKMTVFGLCVTVLLSQSSFVLAQELEIQETENAEQESKAVPTEVSAGEGTPIEEPEPAEEVTATKEIAQCPITLDISIGELRDVMGQIVADTDQGKEGYTYDNSTKTITVNQEIFSCCEEGSSTHELIITGNKTGWKLILKNSGDLPYDVTVNSLTVSGLRAEVEGNLAFQGDTTINGDGLELPIVSGNITLEEEAQVTAYSDSSNVEKPIDGAGLPGKAHVLTLKMDAIPTTATALKIAGRERVLPEGRDCIAVMDNSNGSWLSTIPEEMKVQLPDESQDYVRGLTEESYGNTFQMDDTGLCRYENIRIPRTIKQLDVSVSTSGVSDITSPEGSLQLPKISLINHSYRVEDEYQASDGSIMEFGRTNPDISVGYVGIRAKNEDNDYILVNYGSQKEVDMVKEADRPKVTLVLTATGEGINPTPIPLDETNDQESVPDWFCTEVGKEVILEFCEPGIQENTPYCQSSHRLKEGEILEGSHTLILNFGF